MSKKKNTLKDLDEFLKQQAATLVPPTPLSEKIETAKPSPIEEKTVAEVPKKTVVDEPPMTITPVVTQTTAKEISIDKILEDIETLAQKEGTTFRKKIYDLVLHAADTEDKSLPEDKMLINTVLYLTNGPRWKDAIRDYWRAKG